MQDFFSNAAGWVLGVFLSIINYFAPIADTIHVLLVFFVGDILFGFLASKKLRGESFNPRKVWEKTIPKMLVSFFIIISAHMLDSISPLGFLTIRESVGWILSGLVLHSVWKNAFIVTKWTALKHIGAFLSDSLKDRFKIDVNKFKEDEDE
ncbi:MAG TPA: phage holin family protein, partial [Thermoclostridium sp.]|nr:phage holin family protein [Thermoclostridium sp.]